MAKHKPEPEPETVADESTLQTGTPDETIAEQVAAIPATTNDEVQVSHTRRLAEQLIEQAALDAQDPIVYRYIGGALPSERLLNVPLADIRRSLWAELPPWAQRSVKASPLYLETDEVSNG